MTYADTTIKLRFSIDSSKRLTDRHVPDFSDANIIRVSPEFFHPRNGYGILLLDVHGLIVIPNASMLESSLLRLHNGMFLLHLVISVID